MLPPTRTLERPGLSVSLVELAATLKEQAGFDVHAEYHPDGSNTQELRKQKIRLGKKEADVLGVSERSLTPEAVQRAHEHGLELWVYTVNGTARATELLDWGVDGLITDRPAEMRALAPFAP